MRRNYTPEFIESCCKEVDGGTDTATVCNNHNVPKSTMYYWLKKYGDIISEGKFSEEIDSQKLKAQNKKLNEKMEIFRALKCTPSSPLRERLYELESLYGKYSITLMCDMLDVSRGTFFNHLYRNKRDNSEYAKRRNELKVVLRDVFDEFHGLLGSDKLLAILQQRGYHTSKRMIRELMKEMKLRSIRSTTKKDYMMWKKLHETKDRVNRDFNVDKPNMVWVSDITQVKICDKHYYICVILDLFSRKVIAYNIGPKASTQLLTSTFKDAISTREYNDEIIFHSDQGTQYTSYSFRKSLIEHNFKQSFSKKGTPYDNSVMESFFASYKKEDYYRKEYKSLVGFKKGVAEYMEFYNNVRPHRYNNYKSPNKAEELFYKNLKNLV